jgi:FG-GAP repeat protein/VCBS repeat protein
MTTFSLNHIVRRWLVSFSGILLGLIAATLLLLWIANTPHRAQAADSPHPAADAQSASDDWWAAIKDQLARDSSISPAALTSSPAQILNGETTGEDFGYPVATAGDVNGDGYADVIVGAYLYNNGTGRAYVYMGSANGLSTTPVFTATGEEPDSAFGFAAATAGDVNGDGYADVIVGASNYGVGGRIYLFFGSASGLSSTPAFTATGSIPGGNFGLSATAAGDVNGDGYADVIVGAPNSNPPDMGHAYLYLGSASGLSATPAFTGTGEMDAYGISAGTAGDVNGDGYADVIIGEIRTGDSGRAYIYLGTASGLSATPALTLTGEASNDSFGRSVGTAGDVNGDGYADVIVGASSIYSYTGQAYVYLGSASGLSATPAFIATGETTDSQLGLSAATAGDVNSDGYADIVIGAPRYNNFTGRSYVYLGSANGLKTTPALTVTGEATNSAFGGSAATAGDVNGDGYVDIIIGAPEFGSGTGRAYVYHGAADLPGSTPVFTATGETPGDYSGNWTGTAGDVNGDGYADIIVGAPAYSNTGRVHVYLGSASGLSATPAFTATGEGSGDGFGFSVGTAGDVNGDGYDDVIVGAYGYNSYIGRAYVYLGSASGLSSILSFAVTGEGPSDQFGLSVATAGDVNGDGYSDVVIGARGYSSNTGRAYVYFGSANGLSASPAFTATGEANNNYFGQSVGTAGDVNGDGYSDIIVGATGYLTATGRAYVYLGSSSGLSTTPAFTVTGEHFYSLFGWPVGTTGDVNGDGYSEVIVGAIFYTGTGRAYVYSGSASGLSATPMFTATGETNNENLGIAAATGGDTNGDGYADVIIGAPGYISMTGRALVYLGSADGPSTTPAFSVTGVISSGLGYPVGTAGDVNGDGYADLLIGEGSYINNLASVHVYPGNGNYGLSLAPQQRRADNSAPIAQGGRSDSESAFRIAALGRSPFGRGKVKLEWEVKPLGTPLDGTGTQQSSTWMDSGTAGAAFDELVTGLSANTVYHWRVRILYHPATTPFQQYSRWFTQPWNGWQEADFRTALLKLYFPLISR